MAGLKASLNIQNEITTTYLLRSPHRSGYFVSCYVTCNKLIMLRRPEDRKFEKELDVRQLSLTQLSCNHMSTVAYIN